MVVVGATCTAHHGRAYDGVDVVAVPASELVKRVCFVDGLRAASLSRDVVVDHTYALVHELSRAHESGIVPSCTRLSPEDFACVLSLLCRDGSLARRQPRTRA